MTDSRKEKIIYGLTAWIAIGIVLAFIGTSMLITGRPSADPFYKVGDVWEIPWRSIHSVEIQEDGHREKSGKIILDNGHFVWNFIGIEGKHRYFYININDIDCEDLRFECEFIREKKGKVVSTYTKTIKPHEGLNRIRAKDRKFTEVHLHIYGSSGGSFNIVSMEFRQTKKVFTFKKAFIYAGSILLFYAAVSALIRKYLQVKKHPERRFIEGFDKIAVFLQNIYIAGGNRIAGILRITELKDSTRRRIRTALFALMILYSQFVDVCSLYRKLFFRNMGFYAFLLILAALFCVEGKLEKVNWKHSLGRAWILLWGMGFIADIFVLHTYRFFATVMLFAMSAFYFALGNMKRKGDVIRDFAAGVHIYFIVCALFCLLCRPDTESIRYCGISTNPAITGICMGMVAIISLAELEYLFRKEKGLLPVLLLLAEFLIAMSFCWKAQGLFPLLAVMFMLCIWVVRCRYYERKSGKKHRLAVCILCMVLLFMPVYKLVDTGVNTLPHVLGTEVSFKKDLIITSYAPIPTATVVYAADTASSALEKFSESRLGRKFSDLSFMRIINARENYYKTYLRNMNLTGHADNPKMWGEKRFPHNNMIGIAYRYGIFSVVPYIVMLLAFLIKTIKLSRKNEPENVLILYTTVSVLIMSLIDNIEQPFIWLPWFALYILAGRLFAAE